MTVEVAGMITAGAVALVAGVGLLRPRFLAASGEEGVLDRLLLLGPLCYAIALAIFAAEHYTAPHDLVGIVPKWLPFRMFWVYFVGTAWLAAAISFILARAVRWSAPLAALMMLLIVATLDVPGIPAGLHHRFFWILFAREMSFAGGAMVLGGSVWPSGNTWGAVLRHVGRTIVGVVMIFYAVEHFLHPHHVVGVPLEKLIPAWMPAPVLLAWIVGIALLAGGIGLFFRPTVRIAAAGAGTVLLLVTIFFYGALLVAEFHSNPVEGLNYVGDTLMFAGTVLLAGLEPGPSPTEHLGRRRSSESGTRRSDGAQLTDTSSSAASLPRSIPRRSRHASPASLRAWRRRSIRRTRAGQSG
jgi:uncharacterized membrane protein